MDKTKLERLVSATDSLYELEGLFYTDPGVYEHIKTASAALSGACRTAHPCFGCNQEDVCYLVTPPPLYTPVIKGVQSDSCPYKNDSECNPSNLCGDLGSCDSLLPVEPQKESFFMQFFSKEDNKQVGQALPTASPDEAVTEAKTANRFLNVRVKKGSFISAPYDLFALAYITGTWTLPTKYEGTFMVTFGKEGQLFLGRKPKLTPWWKKVLSAIKTKGF
jgi:hypothetical protein